MNKRLNCLAPPKGRGFLFPVKKWDKRFIEDWGATCSDDYKAFCRAFKSFLKRNFPEAELTGFKANHYDTSGFISQNGKVVYISQNMDRYSPNGIDFSIGGTRGILYRTAKDTKDYKGGNNNFCSINELVENVNKLLI